MGTEAAGAFAALLDRSLVQMAEASADARTYDRKAIYTVADVWDNNTFPLFRAMAARTSWGRERRARAALKWMADLGAERRTWMVEQSAIAGYRLEPLLPPQVKRDRGPREPSRRRRPRRQPEPLEDVALVAATILHGVMMEIRMVRHAAYAGRTDVRPLCLALAGAGEAILAASTHGRASRREAAFRHMVEHWVREGELERAPWFAGRLRGLADATGGATREWVGSLIPPLEGGGEREGARAG
ncbi:hypothetical protein [Microbispora sp. NPDC049125]|uniref:hypothetical protein n=1 Tax=Microbispora sp. NPDC049125 TaxID=3154929 RepID=UPI0034665942